MQGEKDWSINLQKMKKQELFNDAVTALKKQGCLGESDGNGPQYYNLHSEKCCIVGGVLPVEVVKEIALNKHNGCSIDDILDDYAGVAKHLSSKYEFTRSDVDDEFFVDRLQKIHDLTGSYNIVLRELKRFGIKELLDVTVLKEIDEHAV